MSIRIQKLNTVEEAYYETTRTVEFLRDQRYPEPLGPDFTGVDTFTIAGHFKGVNTTITFADYGNFQFNTEALSVRYDDQTDVTTIIGRFTARDTTFPSPAWQDDHFYATVKYTASAQGILTMAVDITDKVEQPVNFSWRLDRELDGAGFTYIETDTAHKSRIVEPLTLFRVQHFENETLKDEQIMVGTDERTVLRPTTAVMSGLFRHRVQLTEATKLLQGVLIDGSHTTQGTTAPTTQSVAQAVQRLLQITPCRTDGQPQKYFLDTTDDNYQSLAFTVAPQFTFNTQSTLWECLCEAFSVVDSIPELVISLDEVHHKLTYLIRAIQPNRPTAVIDSLIDNATYSYGEQVNAEQVNSGLTAVAENIFEE